ncbi:MAG TPA: PilZ domain-containing protein [Opitutaceae bacterium]|nr:PilZ domain-containing protein [Opitutaceae bacterium]
MPFFDEAPQVPVPPRPAVERRGEQRFPIPPDLPIRTGLSLVGRDDTGAPMSDSRHNWNWKGRLVDFSGEGARIQMGPGVRGDAGDSCDLLLSIEDFEAVVPSEIANVGQTPDGAIFGLKHRIEDEETWRKYSLLLEVVALGSTLALTAKQATADESGFAVEQYASAWGSRLTVWRRARKGAVAAFELVMNDALVRAAQGEPLEYLAGADASLAPPADRDRANELHRRFHWVVPCLSAAVPEDVRKFLRSFA